MSLQSELSKRARVWASEITKEAHKNLGKFKRLIKVQSSVGSDKNGKITVTSTASNIAYSEYGDKKIVAKAYEYGSGIHGRERRKYRIAPRRKKVLAFFWDKFDSMSDDTKEAVWQSPKFAGFSQTDDRLLFHYVEHPGIEAANNGQGYMRPAIRKIRKQIRNEVPSEVRKEVIGSFRRAFKK